MENKVILELIKKDLEELALLVDAMREEKELSKNWIDLTLTKAKTLLNEFALLQALPKSETEFSPQLAAKVPSDEPSELKNENELIVLPVETIVSQAINNLTSPEEIFSEEIPAQKGINGNITEPDRAEILTLETERVTVHKTELFAMADDGNGIKTNEPESIELVLTRDQALFEVSNAPVMEKPDDSVSVKEKRVLGELFTKEPSLNEKLALNKTLDTKIKARPVHSLKSAIGINDKFLYMRELFANDNKTFEHTLNHLDQAENLVQAIEYLEGNFKWQKTETSLKFLDLVKRRFEN